ncbi:hypothetical protein BH23VER1_BH23VER1_19120 [soil metagenome]
MTVITFLGTGNYQPCPYLWEGREIVETPFFQEALVRWLRPERTLVFVTGRADQVNGAPLRDQLARDPSLPAAQFVAIPDGANPAELREIFALVAEHIGDGEDIVFDITHSFRSIPLIVLLVIAYVREAKGARLLHLLYGAFEARQAGGPAPVFDLSSFVSLLDWTAACRQFRQSGDPGAIGALLRGAQNAAWNDAPDHESLPKLLAGMGTNLEALATAIAVARPHEVRETAAKTLSKLAEIGPEAGRWAAPFLLLLERATRSFSDLANPDLRGEFATIRYCVEHRLHLQAITLLREWVVTFTATALGFPPLERRDEVEKSLNAAANAITQQAGGIQGDRTSVPDALDALMALPEQKRITEAWVQIRTIRNDVAHCGMRKQPLKAKRIVSLVERLVAQVGEWNYPRDEEPAPGSP